MSGSSIRRAGVVWSCVLAACADREPAPQGQALEIVVAPVSYPGLAEVCYGISVTRGAPGQPGTTPVWSASALCSGQYGNGAGGDLAYVGPCDASGGPNHVALVVESIEVAGGAMLDDQIAAPADADFINPCPATQPCVQPAACAPNADTRVVFNLTVMRDAGQGFFDIAVSFEDVFCSAKLDCQYDTGPIVLLHRPDGTRGQTAVLAFACTTGSGQVRDTVLHMNDVRVDCGGDVIDLDPTAGPGLVWRDGNLDPDPTDAVWQYATYLGIEALPCGVQPCNKLYWNIAIGFDPSARDCTLSASATVSTTTQMTDALTPLATTYPWIAFEAALTADVAGGGLVCDQNPINEPGSAVTTEYTPVDAQKPFCHRFDGIGTSTAAACAPPCEPIGCPSDACAVIEDGCGGTIDCRPASQDPRAIVRNMLSVDLRPDATGQPRVVLPARTFDAGSYDLQSAPQDLELLVAKGFGGAFAGSLSLECADVGVSYALVSVTDEDGNTTWAATPVMVTDTAGVCTQAHPAREVTALCHAGIATVVAQRAGVVTADVPANAFDAGSSAAGAGPLSWDVSLVGVGTFAPSLDLGCDEIGERPVDVRVTDGSGHTDTCQSWIDVQDPTDLCGSGGANSTAPTPIVRSGLTTSLHRMGSPACPVVGACARIEIPALAFEQASYDDETPGAGLGLRIAEPFGGFGAVASFDCNNLGQQPIWIEVTDGDGQASVVQTFVTIQDNDGVCDTGCGTF